MDQRPIFFIFVVTLLTISSCGGGDSSSSGDSVTLSWAPPTTNMDGSLLTDLAGYKIYYGTSSGSYETSIDVGNVTKYKVDSLSSGITYYFAVTAYDIFYNESGFSNEVIRLR